MQPVIQPAIQSGQPLFLARDHAAVWVEVEPGLLRVIVSDAQHRQPTSPTSVVVVAVIRPEPGPLDDVDAWHDRHRQIVEHRVLEPAERTLLRVLDRD